MMIIAITLISALAAYLVYQTPRSYSRHQAPAYVLDMMDATDVRWDLSTPGEVGGMCEIDYPPDPRHRYIIIVSIVSGQKKNLAVAGGPLTMVSKGDRIAVDHRRNIGSQGFSNAIYILPDENLNDATIWAEIRIENSSGSVLYHGVKQSETYGEAYAKTHQQSSPASPE